MVTTTTVNSQRKNGLFITFNALKKKRASRLRFGSSRTEALMFRRQSTSGGILGPALDRLLREGD